MAAEKGAIQVFWLGGLGFGGLWWALGVGLQGFRRESRAVALEGNHKHGLMSCRS